MGSKIIISLMLVSVALIPGCTESQLNNDDNTSQSLSAATTTCEIDSDCSEDYECLNEICVIKYYTVTPPFEEDFSTASNRQYFEGTIFSGNTTWVFEDGVAESELGGFLSRKVNATDYIIEVDFNHAGDGGILVRGDGATLDYYGSPSGIVFIYRPVITSYGVKLADGDAYWISYSPAMQGSWGYDINPHTTISGTQGNVHLKIVVQGNTFTAYANSAEMASYVDTAGTYSGEERKWIALYYNSYGIEGQSFDNLEIKPV